MLLKSFVAAGSRKILWKEERNKGMNDRVDRGVEKLVRAGNLY